MSRNELYLKMRYLDVALSSLRFGMDGEIGSIGTDGQGLYFHPGWLGGAVPGRTGGMVNRAYLHVVLHCLFGHLYLRGNRDPVFWDLACNIAVESIIDSLSYPCVRRAPSWLRKDVYRRLEKEHEGADSAQKSIQKPDSLGDERGKKRMETGCRSSGRTAIFTGRLRRRRKAAAKGDGEQLETDQRADGAQSGYLRPGGGGARPAVCWMSFGSPTRSATTTGNF